MKHFGKLALPSGRLIMTDPLYVSEAVINEIETGDASQSGESVLDLRVPGDADVHYEISPEEGRISAVHLFFVPASALNADDPVEEIEVLGVDSGQMSYCDAAYLADEWTESDYHDIRKYRHKAEGRVLQYGVDFPHYQSPIASEGGLNMNELNASGDWESLPYDGPMGVNYNGMCHCHDDVDNIGRLDDRLIVSGTGYGDGGYEVLLRRAPDDTIACVSIIFIGEEEEDEE